MELHYKCTTWNKLKFNDDVPVETIKEMLNQGHDPDDIMNALGESISYETISEVEEFISLDENEGNSTMELYVDNTMIWDNSYESQLKRKEENNG